MTEGCLKLGKGCEADTARREETGRRKENREEAEGLRSDVRVKEPDGVWTKCMS